MILSSLIFLLTLIAIITQPYKLQIGTIAILGALVSLAVGTVSFGDVLIVTDIVWDATLAFIGIIILSIGT
jgi:arsenical pump membrane protein